MDKLDEIIAHKKREIAERIRPVRDAELEHLSRMVAERPIFRKALKREGGLAVIAEIKRKSPSVGQIKTLPEATEQARLYYNASADALSILTDETYFSGTLRDLWEVTDFIAQAKRNLPCLRKDFMVHPIQVVEAAEAGASCILIIVRALDDEALKPIYEAAQLAGLDALFEVHNEQELERALAYHPKLIGVNNRDLARFKTDLAYSERLLPMIPPEIVRISESGIKSPEDASRARAAGADAILVGEALMRAEAPEELISAFHTIDANA